jgi:hypothetical protein
VDEEIDRLAFHTYWLRTKPSLSSVFINQQVLFWVTGYTHDSIVLFSHEFLTCFWVDSSVDPLLSQCSKTSNTCHTRITEYLVYGFWF